MLQLQQDCARWRQNCALEVNWEAQPRQTMGMDSEEGEKAIALADAPLLADL